ncbi:hypothetical protein CW304_13575 [Bacillus sp. UFRGS-B20]|nr:hypothetical protein CW304_13575 [Bacillus sp. UFRGS-B20]
MRFRFGTFIHCFAKYSVHGGLIVLFNFIELLFVSLALVNLFRIISYFVSVCGDRVFSFVLVGH